MAVSLLDLGQNQFGKSGSVSLNDLAGADGYTRTYAASGYYRVNPFEVANGDAPAPASGANALSDWDGYAQATINPGSNFDCTASPGPNSVGFDWTQGAGYGNDLASVRQRFFYQTCTGPIDCASADPFSGSPMEQDAGDGASDTLTGLSDNTYYVVGLQVEWDRKGDGSYEIPASNGSNPTARVFSPTGLCNGAANQGIWFQTDTTTTTTTACSSCCPITLCYDLFGCTAACSSSNCTTYYTEFDTPQIGDDLYTNSGCTTTVSPGGYSDGANCYTVSGGTITSATACP